MYIYFCTRTKVFNCKLHVVPSMRHFQKMTISSLGKMCLRLRTVLKPQVSEVQRTLKDITPAWLIFSRHKHQVAVDEHCDLKETGETDHKTEKRRKGNWWEGDEVEGHAAMLVYHIGSLWFYTLQTTAIQLKRTCTKRLETRVPTKKCCSHILNYGHAHVSSYIFHIVFCSLFSEGKSNGF